jgi:hypothetical protein
MQAAEVLFVEVAWLASRLILWSSLEAAGYVLPGFSSVTQPTTYRSSKTHGASEHELAVWRRRSIGVDCLLHVCLRASVSYEYLPS